MDRIEEARKKLKPIRSQRLAKLVKENQIVLMGGSPGMTEADHVEVLLHSDVLREIDRSLGRGI